MVSVSEAEKIILNHLFKPLIEKISLVQADDRILAEEIKADRDLPPFNRATMDGIAIAYKTFEQGQRQYEIENIQAAGRPQQKLIDPKKCFEIMTGAPLPEGADTVIPYESISIENKSAIVSAAQASKLMNVHLLGSDAKQNGPLLTKGTKISPAEMAILASVGKSEVSVFKAPTSAIISTGDELIEITQNPLPHQIRKSNEFALTASLKSVGCRADAFHLKDDIDQLTQKVKSILNDYELVILSGGVSKGKFDFVPQVLESLGVKKLFHGVKQRPGKPMWFGVSDKNFVFALPGNPVSTFMCFYRYVRLWIESSMKQETKLKQAILAKDFLFAPQLTYFLQVRIENENGKMIAYPDVGGGSGDFVNLKDVDGFLELPLEQNEFKAGTAYTLYSFR